MKKNVLIIGAISLILAFTGCGNTNSGEVSSAAAQKEINPQELLTSVSNKMAEVKSYEAVTDINFKVASQGQELNMDMDMNMKVINAPSLTMQVDSKTKMAMGEETQNIDMAMYLEPAEGGYTFYQNLDDAWYKTSIATEDEVANYIKAPGNTVDEYIGLSDGVTQGEDETVNGVDCDKLLVNIPVSKLGELMNQMGSIGASAESMLGSIAEAEDFAIEMLVSQEDETLVQVRMDLSDIMKNALKGQEGVEEKDLESIEFGMNMSFSNLEGVNEIVIPEEAKSATEM